MFDKLKQAGKKVMDKVKPVMDDQDYTDEQIDTLRTWQMRFSDAKGNYQKYLDYMNKREWLYLGTPTVDGNINNPVTPAEGRKLANNVRNVAYELIESQVDNQTPGPVVKAKSQDIEYLAQIVESSLKANLDAVNIERLNDQQERTTPIQGYSFFEVFWNKNKKSHNYIGDVDVRLIHPKQVIPQPGVWRLQEMDYFFVISSVTHQYIKDRYGVDVHNESEQYPEINTIGQINYSRVQSKKVSEIVCWYKDEDGDISRFVYCNNVILEDLPKLFKRRLDGKQVDTENMLMDYQTEAGLKIPAGTPIPYFTPDRYPIIMRENTPLYYQFGGQSDIDVIADQIDSIKKVVSKIEEKILKGGSIIGLPATQKGKFKVTDDEVKIMWLQPGESTLINDISLQPDITKDLAFYNQQYDAAKATLGITNSFQGQADTTAKSGIAKQVQIAQSSGRMKSKQANKLQAYQELFEVMFQFKLAYTDEERPYQTIDSQGNINYSTFNRYEFLRKDADGQYYYESDFMFDADPNSSLASDKVSLMQNALDMFRESAINKYQLWQVMEQLNFPMAAQIKKQIEQTMYLNFYDKPKVTLDYRDMPYDAQMQFLGQIGLQSNGQISPEAIIGSRQPLQAVQAAQTIGILPQPQAPQQNPQQQQQFQQILNQMQTGQINQQQAQQAIQQMQPQQQSPLNDIISQLSPEEQQHLQEHPETLDNAIKRVGGAQ